MKINIIVLVFTVSTLVQAAPVPPYIESLESSAGGRIDQLVLSETKDSKVFLFNCVINKTAVKFLGSSPVCSQKVTCSQGEIATNAIVEPSILQATFNCAISSESAGCRSKTWQDCAIDKELPNELGDACLSESPGVIKSGCPQMKSQGSLQPSDKVIQ